MDSTKTQSAASGGGTTLVERPPLLQIRNLKTYFYLAEGVVRAVDGVDLDVHHRQTLGVVGESGCGKSITSLSILRLVAPPGRIVEGGILYYRPERRDRPGGGSVATEVIDLVKLDPNGPEIRGIRGGEISMVFQEPMTAMSPIIPVGRQIAETIVEHEHISPAAARRRAIDILSRVGLPKAEKAVDDYPFQLSGGMRQRAVIAMALACNPSLLIADEPTTALDVTTEAQILDLLRELQRELGMAIMYITHNLGVVAEMAEQVAVMYLGKVVEQAPTTAIFFEPKHPYTRGLLRSIPRLGSKTRGRLETISGMVPDPYATLAGCPFHPRCPEFRKGLCDQVVPSVTSVGPGHTVRCHLYG